MTDPRDDELLGRVRRALSSPDDTTDDMVDMIMTGYDLTSAGMLIAELIEESASVPVRSGEPQARYVTCVADGLTIRFEILEWSVLGEVDPPGVGTIELQQAEEFVRGEVLASGAFEVERPSDAPFRLVYSSAVSAPVVATPWILP